MKTGITFLIATLALVLSGCTGFQVYPSMARAGDTVSFAVGSPDGMTQANTTVVFQYDFDQSQVDLTANVRSIYKLRSDPVSGIGLPNSPDIELLVYTSGHEPWVGIITVDLDPGMMTGTGEMLVTTTASYPTIGSHINDLQANGRHIALEIVPGVGSSSLFPHEAGAGGINPVADLSRLEAQPHALIYPTFLGAGNPYSTYGAIEMTLDVNASGTVDEKSMVIHADNMTMATKSMRSVAYGINNNNPTPEMTVVLTSVTGDMEYFEARFAMAAQNGAILTSVPVITSVSYFDLNGAPTTGPAIGDYMVLLN